MNWLNQVNDRGGLFRWSQLCAVIAVAVLIAGCATSGATEPGSPEQAPVEQQSDRHEPQQFTIGETYRGVLDWQRVDVPGTDHTGDAFELRVDEDALLHAHLYVEDFDGELVVTDEDDNRVARAGADGRSVDPVRLGETLEPGDYTLFVGADPDSQGSFELLVELDEPPGVETLRPDTTVDGMLTDRARVLEQRQSFVVFHRLKLEEPTRLELLLKSEDFDAYLFVVDGDGELIADNHDAHIGTTDSRIEQQFEPGSYRIGATSLTPATTGAFELTVQRTLP